MHPLHHEYLFSVSRIIVSSHIAISSYSATSIKIINELRNGIVNHKSQRLDFGMQSLMGGRNVQSQPNVDTYTFSKDYRIMSSEKFGKNLKYKKLSY